MAVVTRFMQQQILRLEAEILNLKASVKTKSDDLKLAFARTELVAAELRRALVPNRLSHEDKLRAQKSFDAWYYRYPRKVGRKEAVDAWMSRPELHNMEGEPFQQAMYALDCWKDSRQWCEEDGIPYPATWLNKQRDKDFPRPRQKAEG
jgi:hypothetical protein